jgi:hypothetical protein
MCPKCSSRVKNLYQHCRDVHGSTLKLLQAEDIPAESTSTVMNEESQGVICNFERWLTSVDGGALSAKTAESYKSCVTKTVNHACSGDFRNIVKYSEWSRPDGYLDQLQSRLSNSTVATYLHALTVFVVFLQRSNILFKNGAADATDTFKRWNVSLKKGKQQERVAQVAKVQIVVPRVAANMQAYSASQQYK